eukprot:gene24933-biopygen14993
MAFGPSGTSGVCLVAVRWRVPGKRPPNFLVRVREVRVTQVFHVCTWRFSNSYGGHRPGLKVRLTLVRKDEKMGVKRAHGLEVAGARLTPTLGGCQESESVSNSYGGDRPGLKVCLTLVREDLGIAGVTVEKLVLLCALVHRGISHHACIPGKTGRRPQFRNVYSVAANCSRSYLLAPLWCTKARGCCKLYLDPHPRWGSRLQVVLTGTGLEDLKPLALSLNLAFPINNGTGRLLGTGIPVKESCWDILFGSVVDSMAPLVKRRQIPFGAAGSWAKAGGAKVKSASIAKIQKNANAGTLGVGTFHFCDVCGCQHASIMPALQRRMRCQDMKIGI